MKQPFNARRILINKEMKKMVDKRLKFLKVLFNLLPIVQTMRANTTERKILGSARLVVFAVSAWEVFATASAALKKNHFGA